MPYRDDSKNYACSRAWALRNPERMKAAAARYREKQRKLRAAGIIVKPNPENYFRSAPPEQRKLFYKLRRCGIDLDTARMKAFGR